MTSRRWAVWRHPEAVSACKTPRSSRISRSVGGGGNRWAPLPAQPVNLSGGLVDCPLPWSVAGQSRRAPRAGQHPVTPPTPRPEQPPSFPAMVQRCLPGRPPLPERRRTPRKGGRIPPAKQTRLRCSVHVYTSLHGTFSQARPSWQGSGLRGRAWGNRGRVPGSQERISRLPPPPAATSQHALDAAAEREGAAGRAGAEPRG